MTVTTLLRHVITLSILMSCGICGGVCRETTKIILLSSSHTSPDELQSLSSMAADGEREIVSVPVKDLDTDKLKGADIVIYHRVDSSAFCREEIDMKDPLLAYVVQPSAIAGTR